MAAKPKSKPKKAPKPKKPAGIRITAHYTGEFQVTITAGGKRAGWTLEKLVDVVHERGDEAEYDLIYELSNDILLAKDKISIKDKGKVIAELHCDSNDLFDLSAEQLPD
jgi:hypothetical protein